MKHKLIMENWRKFTNLLSESAKPTASLRIINPSSYACVIFLNVNGQNQHFIPLNKVGLAVKDGRVRPGMENWHIIDAQSLDTIGNWSDSRVLQVSLGNKYFSNTDDIVLSFFDYEGLDSLLSQRAESGSDSVRAALSNWETEGWKIEDLTQQPGEDSTSRPLSEEEIDSIMYCSRRGNPDCYRIGDISLGPKYMDEEARIYIHNDTVGIISGSDDENNENED